MPQTQITYHVHHAQPEGWFQGQTCALKVAMDDQHGSYVSAYFGTPDDVRATIASLTEALAQWEAYLASKSEAA